MFSVVYSACPMNEDYNTVVPIRRAIFFHLYKTIIVQFFKGFFNVSSAAMATVQCCKKTLSKITLKNVMRRKLNSLLRMSSFDMRD